MVRFHASIFFLCPSRTKVSTRISFCSTRVMREVREQTEVRSRTCTSCVALILYIYEYVCTRSTHAALSFHHRRTRHMCACVYVYMLRDIIQLSIAVSKSYNWTYVHSCVVYREIGIHSTKKNVNLHLQTFWRILQWKLLSLK